MNHPPFDPGQPLTPDLQEHLRQCPSCWAMWQVDQLLRSAPPVSPPPGFVERFQMRLAGKRRAPQAPRPWLIALPVLVLLLSLGASGLILPLSGSQLFLSFFPTAASLLERSLLLVRALLLLFRTFYRYLPSHFWISLFASGAALFYLWLFSLRRAQLFWIQVRR